MSGGTLGELRHVRDACARGLRPQPLAANRGMSHATRESSRLASLLPDFARCPVYQGTEDGRNVNA